MTQAQEVARILLKIKAVTLRPNEPYRYTSGILSPIYTDCRLLISFPKERDRVIELLAGMLNEKPDVIAGTATAGIPHAAWLAQKLGLPMIYSRSKVKAHGKQMQVEGVLQAGQTAVVVEDLISTGRSSLETIEVVRNSGATANKILAIFNYQLPQSAENFKTANVELSALTSFKDVVALAVEDGYLDAKDQEMVVAWSADSANWAKDQGIE